MACSKYFAIDVDAIRAHIEIERDVRGSLIGPIDTTYSACLAKSWDTGPWREYKFWKYMYQSSSGVSTDALMAGRGSWSAFRVRSDSWPSLANGDLFFIGDC